MDTVPSATSVRFLSTPSARRATCSTNAKGGAAEYFYPRPPRGGRLAYIGGDVTGGLFLSTPSARRATGRSQLGIIVDVISIHALREEGDPVKRYSVEHPIFLSTPSARRATLCPVAAATALTNFYPRPPRGGRRHSSRSLTRSKAFLSTPSARRATMKSITTP